MVKPLNTEICAAKFEATLLTLKVQDGETLDTVEPVLLHKLLTISKKEEKSLVRGQDMD